MRYINKADKEPDAFQQWKEDIKEELERLLANPDTPSRRIWRLLDRKSGVYNKKMLRAHLIEEQGYLCCYCGRRITLNKNNTVIDHLFPKSKFRDRTYDYENLLLSCTGGSRNIVHVLREDESLESVAIDYGVPMSRLQLINVSQNQVEVMEKTYDLTNLKSGDKIIIILKADRSRQHCDTKKRESILPIHPLQPDCESHFKYDALDGRIVQTSEAVAEAVSILGLNANPFIVQQRKNTLDEAYNKLKAIIEAIGPNDKEQFNKLRKKLLRRYQKPNGKTGRLPAFAFVTKAVLANG